MLIYFINFNNGFFFWGGSLFFFFVVAFLYTFLWSLTTKLAFVGKPGCRDFGPDFGHSLKLQC